MHLHTIDTLIDDVYAVLAGTKTPSSVVDDITSNAEFAKRVISHIHADLVPDDRSDRDPTEVYVTQFSNPCRRKGWYERHHKTAIKEHAISGHGKFKFLYGDLIEESFLYLAKAAGHHVADTQRRFSRPMVEDGELKLAGRIDAMIDGWLVDVKSADPYTFERVVTGQYEDKFGYEKQLQAYHWLSNGDCEGIANIFINKVNGKMHILKWAMPTLTALNAELANFYVDMLDPNVAPHDPLWRDHGELSVTCSYCPYKFECFKNLSVFAYSKGPTFVVTSECDKKIKVPDITDAYKKQADVRPGNGKT